MWSVSVVIKITASPVLGAGRRLTPISADVPTSVFATVLPLEEENSRKKMVRAATKSIEPHYTHSEYN